jgi:hypothetical protein
MRDRPLITGFYQDDDGDWVVRLSCGHTQHVRHRPPFMQRPWVITESGRQAQRGRPFECGWCRQARAR